MPASAREHLEAIARLRESGALAGRGGRTGRVVPALPGGRAPAAVRSEHADARAAGRTRRRPAGTRAGVPRRRALDVRLAEARDSVRRVYTSVLACMPVRVRRSVRARGRGTRRRSGRLSRGSGSGTVPGGKHVRTSPRERAGRRGCARSTAGRRFVTSRSADARAAATPTRTSPLHNIVTLAAAQRFPEVFYRQLGGRADTAAHRTPRFRDQRLVRFLARDPSDGAPRRRTRRDRHAVAAPRATGPPPAPREREEARLVAAHVLGLTTFDDLTRG